MRRVVIASAIVCSALAAPVLAATGAGGTATLDHFSCRHSSQARDRIVSVQAVMRHRDGTRRMAMRFELLWTAPGSSSGYKEHGGDLGQWRHPTNPPTLGQQPNDVWRMTQKVRDLSSEGTYQFRVYFRWTGQGQSTLYETSLLSRRCRQHA
jgi:hypothetical protein